MVVDGVMVDDEEGEGEEGEDENMTAGMKGVPKSSDLAIKLVSGTAWACWRIEGD